MSEQAPRGSSAGFVFSPGTAARSRPRGGEAAKRGNRRARLPSRVRRASVPEVDSVRGLAAPRLTGGLLVDLGFEGALADGR